MGGAVKYSEYQATTGTVNTSTSTPFTGYNYTENAGSQNNDRLVSMVYPNGRVEDYCVRQRCIPD